MFVLIRIILFLLFVFSIYWPVIAYRSWHGRWRLVALLALCFPLLFITRIIVNLILAPADYSLPLLEFALATLGSLMIMSLATLLKRRSKTDLQ